MEERLRKFAVLIDAGSFTAAAAGLHVSQPALSVSMKKLERELGVELLARGPRGLRPTRAGRLAYERGRQLAIERVNLKQAIRDLTSDKTPLAIGAIDSVAEALFVQGDELQTLEQWARVSLSINNSSVLAEAVAKLQLDIALVVESSPSIKALAIRPIGVEPLLLVTQRERHATITEALRSGRLAGFLSYNQGSTTERLVAASAQKWGVALEPAFYSTSPEIMLEMVAAGKGVAALPYLLVREHLASGKLAALRLGRQWIIERRIAAVTQNGRRLPAPLEPLLKRCRAELERLLMEAGDLTARS